MRFIIMGYDKRYSSRDRAEPYGTFTERAECCRYLNKLKTGCLSDTTNFFVKEEHGHARDQVDKY